MNAQSGGMGPILAVIVLVAVIALVFSIIRTALKLRPSELARTGASAPKTWATLGVLVLFLVIVILGTPSFFLIGNGG